MGSPSILMRSGWKFNALKFGDKITVRLDPLRNGQPGGLLVLPQHVVLELKFCVKLPAVFQQLIDTFELTPQPVSKYRIAAAALEQVTVCQPVPVATPAIQMGELS